MRGSLSFLSMCKGKTLFFHLLKESYYYNHSNVRKTESREEEALQNLLLIVIFCDITQINQ